LEDYDKNNTFDVKTVNAVTLKEFTEQNIKKQPVEITEVKEDIQEQEKKIEVIFSKNEVPEIEFATYEEAELYSDEITGETFSEEYIDEELSKFGEVSELDSLDLGKPVRPREEVNDDDEQEISTMSEESNIEDTVFYEEPDEFGEPIEDVADVLDDAFTDIEETYAEAYNDFDLPEDEYGLSDDIF
ncbi:MAG: hypothetical protein K2K02_07570, partial [Ruminococcus sp.]|nr:hypothetical protein [Ruminococcus sp.]